MLYKLIYYLFSSLLIIIITVSPASAYTMSGTSSYSQTLGMPVGGVGAGLFNMNPDGSTNTSKLGTVASAAPTFAVYVNRGGTIVSKNLTSANFTIQFEAFYPKVTYTYTGGGLPSGFTIKLTAFSAIIPGEAGQTYDSNYYCSMPAAFFVFTVTNNSGQSIDTSVAIDPGPSYTTRILDGSNIKGISGNNVATLAPNVGGTISCGTAGNFSTTGDFTNDASGTQLASRVTLANGETKEIKFVSAWANVDGFYRTKFSSPYDTNVANFCYTNFDDIRYKVNRWMDKIFSCNIEPWFKDILFNTLHLMASSSKWGSSGPYVVGECGAENGCFDQRHTNSIIFPNFIPDGTWKEMEGHINYQSGSGEVSVFSTSQYLQGKCECQSQLPVMMYMEYLKTGNTARLSQFYTGMKKAMSFTYAKDSSGNKLPEGTRSSYDVQSYGCYPYNDGSRESNWVCAWWLAGLKCAAAIADILNDPSQANDYRNILTTAIASFNTYGWNAGQNSYISDWAKDGSSQSTCIARATLVGEVMTQLLGLGRMLPEARIDATIDKIYSTCMASYGMKNGSDTSIWWPGYILEFAPIAMMEGKVDKGLAALKKYYDAFFVYNPAVWQICVHYNVNTAAGQEFCYPCRYMFGGGIWYGLWGLTGFNYDYNAKKLWIKPNLSTGTEGIANMNNQLVSGPLIGAYSCGTVDYMQNQPLYDQQMTVKFDNPLQFNELYVRNTGDTNITVKKGGNSVPFTLTTTSDEYKITFNSTLIIDSTGVVVTIGLVDIDPTKTVTTAQPATLAADGSATSLISCEIRSNSDIVVTSATNEITFACSGQGVLTGTTKKNAVSGVAAVILTSTLSAGTATVTAAAANLAGSSVQVTTLPPPTKIISTATPLSIFASGLTTSLITARLCYSNNSICTTALNQITFSVTGNVALLSTTKINASAGKATVMLQSGMSIGIATVIATTQNLTQGSVEVRLTNEGVIPVKLINNAGSFSIKADETSTSLITAQAADSNDNPVTTVTKVGGGWTGFSNPGSGSWLYRKPVTITNSAGTLLNDYQVFVSTTGVNTGALKSQGKLQSDYDDVRFADSNDKELYYWIQSSTTNAAGFWVSVSTINSSGTTLIYMYYGNGNAAAASSIKTAFLFGDDFADGAITGYTQVSGTWSETGGILKQTATGSADPCQQTATSITTPNDIEVFCRVRPDVFVAGTGARAGIGARSNGTGGAGRGYKWIMYNTATTVSYLDDGVGFGTSFTFSWSAGTWYNMKLKVIGNNLSARIWANGTAEPASWTTQAWTGRTSGPACMAATVTGTGSITSSYDDFYVRKVVSTEPTVSAGTEETAPPQNDFIVTFTVSGPGTLLGTTSKAGINGAATILLQSTQAIGTITVTSTAETLTQGTVNIITILRQEKLICTSADSSIKADGSSTTMITTLICDEGNVPVTTATESITFSVSGAGTLQGITSKNAVSGAATVVLKSSVSAGTATVTATAANLNAGSVAITVFHPATKLTCSANTTTINANGTSTALIEAAARDSFNNISIYYSNQVTFSVNGQGTLAGTTVKVASAGMSTVILQSTMAAGTVVVTAESSSLQPGTVSITSLPTIMNIVLQISSTYFYIPATVTVTATLKDGNGNLLALDKTLMLKMITAEDYKIDDVSEETSVTIGTTTIPTGIATFSIEFKNPGIYTPTVIPSFIIDGEFKMNNIRAIVNPNAMTQVRWEKKVTWAWLGVRIIPLVNMELPPNSISQDAIFRIKNYDNIVLEGNTELKYAIDQANDYAAFHDPKIDYSTTLMQKTVYDLRTLDKNQHNLKVDFNSSAKPVLSIYYDPICGFYEYCAKVSDRRSTPTNVVEIKPQDLSIFYLDEENKRWVQVISSIFDPVNSCISAEIDHLSVYCLQGRQVGNLILNLANYPNPFSNTTTFIFDLRFDASETKLDIYTSGGRLVYSDDLGPLLSGYTEYSWAGTDIADNNLANGIYLYRVSAKPVSSESTVRATGKLIIMR